MAPHQVHVARVYGPPPDGGAIRVLVDRLWLRGIRKAAAPFGEWLRDVAPSTELRKWYGHGPVRLGEFTSRYQQEVAAPVPAAVLARLRDLLSREDLVLLTAVRDLDLSHAEVLAACSATRPDPGRLFIGPGDYDPPALNPRKTAGLAHGNGTRPASPGRTLARVAPTVRLRRAALGPDRGHRRRPGRG